MAFSGNWLQRRSARNGAASEAYRRLLSEALQPAHYLDHGVFDTFEGRAGMVTALTSLVCARLSQIPGKDAVRVIGRLNDLVLDGFDAAFREKGVGDASIARKVRALAQVHAGMGKALFAVLSGPVADNREAGLATILARNGVVSGEAGPALARWILDCAGHLECLPDAEILHGRIEWIRG
jgi:cytochrome b pre-mRNA-processing protein 3